MPDERGGSEWSRAVTCLLDSEVTLLLLCLFIISVCVLPITAMAFLVSQDSTTVSCLVVELYPILFDPFAPECRRCYKVVVLMAGKDQREARESQIRLIVNAGIRRVSRDS